MDVDTAALAAQVSIKHGLPEIKIYCYLVVLIFLIYNKKYDEVCLGFPFSSDLVFI
jgi:26S proteasome regulatory subunit N3